MQADAAKDAGGERERRYHLLADHATDMIWTIELAGAERVVPPEDEAQRRSLADGLLAGSRFTFVSPAAERLLGFAPQEMLAKTVKQLLAPPSYEKAVDELSDELAAERAGADPQREHASDFLHIRADGTWNWCEVRSRFLRDPQGAICGMLGITRDISSRKAAEEALRDSAATLLNLFTHLPDFVLVVDRDSRIQFVNRDAPGVPADVLMGSEVHEYVLPRYRARCQQALDRAFARQEVQQIQVRSRFNEWLDCRVVPMASGDRPESAMVICTDFTQQRNAERLTRLQLQLSARLSQTSELEPALAACLDTMLSIADAESGGIYLVNPTGDAQLAVHRGLSEDFVRAVSYYEAASEPARMVGGQTPVYPDLDDVPPEIRELCTREGLRPLAILPASHEGRPIACINVASRELAEIPGAVRGGLETTAALIGSSIARIQADLSRRDSEARMRSLVENMPDVVLITDLEGSIRYINRADPVTDRNEVIGTTGLQFFSRDQHDAIRAVYARTIETREAQSYECVDDFGRAWACRAVPMLKDGQVCNLMLINTDVTENRTAVEGLRRSEQKLRLIADNVTDMVWTARIEGTPDLAAVAAAGPAEVDLDGLLDRWQFTFISRSVQDILGYSVDEAMRLRPRDFLTHASYAELRDRFSAGLANLPANTAGGDTRQLLEAEHVTRRGRRKWCEIKSTYLVDQHGHVAGLEGVTRDIGERKRFERELSEIITQQQQQTGQELHDGLAQQLVGVRLLAGGLHQNLADRSDPSAGSAAELIAALHDAETSVRQLIKGVRPVEVAANGLMAALADLVDSTQRLSGIGCEFHCRRPVAIENNHTATQLFYIAREAVHNATKHAAARRISVDLFSDDGQVRLCVGDDGRGMPDDPAPESGIGLRIMRYRASVIGASLVIDTSPGRGTLVTCTLPLESTP